MTRSDDGEPGAIDWWYYGHRLMVRCGLRHPADILSWTVAEICNAMEAVEDDGKPPPPPSGIPNDEWRVMTPLQQVRAKRRQRDG